jgi:hypothetical protein
MKMCMDLRFVIFHLDFPLSPASGGIFNLPSPTRGEGIRMHIRMTILGDPSLC